MTLRYLGTAAAEGVPGIFCDCAVCRQARRAGGRNIRTRSQAVVDETLLIDLPADTYLHVLHYGLDLKKIKSLLLTHSHADHLYPAELYMRRDGFAHTRSGAKLPWLTLFASGGTRRALAAFFTGKDQTDRCRLKIRSVRAFEPFETAGYRVTPLAADHDESTEPLIYMIEKSGKSLLYANDTGYFPEATWSFLEKTKPRFSMVSLDCTGIMINYKTNHMGLDGAADVKQRMLEAGLADETTRWYVNHFSHNGLVNYDTLVPLAKEKGFEVSYDNLSVEF